VPGKPRFEAHLDPEQPSDEDEPVPEEALESARRAFSTRSAGRIAALVYDSLVDGDEPPEDHILRFEHGTFSLTVNVSVRPADVDLSGLASPAAEGRYELVIGQGELSFVYDSSDGSFEFGPVGHGIVRLMFEPSVGDKIFTDWFRI
jgi:hypothetical protein